MLFIYCVHNDIEEQKPSLYLKLHLVCKYIHIVFDQSFMNYQQPVSYLSSWMGPMKSLLSSRQSIMFPIMNLVADL